MKGTREELVETPVCDGQGGYVMVRVGDLVQLHQDSPRGTYPKYDKEYDNLKDCFGEGPFTVSLILKWYCGRIKIYVSGCTNNNRSGGAGAHFFMKVSQ